MLTKLGIEIDARPVFGVPGPGQIFSTLPCIPEHQLEGFPAEARRLVLQLAVIAGVTRLDITSYRLYVYVEFGHPAELGSIMSAVGGLLQECFGSGVTLSTQALQSGQAGAA